MVNAKPSILSDAVFQQNKCDDCSKMYVRQHAARHLKTYVRFHVHSMHFYYLQSRGNELSDQHLKTTQLSTECVYVGTTFQAFIHSNNNTRMNTVWKPGKLVIRSLISIKSWKMRRVVKSCEMRWLSVNTSCQTTRWKKDNPS